MIQLYATNNSQVSQMKSSWWKRECSVVLLCMCLMGGGNAVAQNTRSTGGSTQTTATSALVAGLAQYTAGVSGSASCSGDVFTLTLANVSDNNGTTNKIGSAIIKLPAGIQLEHITSMAVSDGWTIITSFPGEIRLKAHDNLSNAISRDITAASDNKLHLDLKVNVAAEKNVVWQTSVFTRTDWTSNNNGVNLEFALVTLGTNNTRVASSAYPGNTINPLPKVTLSSSDTDNSICAGEIVTFTAAVTNGVAVKQFEFFVNNVSAQKGTAATFNVKLKDGDKVGVKATSDKGCSASGNEIVTKVNPLPVVILSDSDADNIVCEGDEVTFTAGVSNGVPISNYKFMVGEEVKQEGALDKFTMAFNHSMPVKVIATSTSGCTTISDITPIQVNPLPVVILKSSDADNSICAGEMVTFTALVTNNVKVTGYEFFIDGKSAYVSESNQFETTLTDGQKVSAQAICETGCSGLSNVISTKVNELPIATLVSSDTDDTICEGEPVTFTAGVENGVAIESYQFFVDGEPVANTGASFTTVLSHGQEVTVEATSVYGCVDKSEKIVTTVNVKPVLGDFAFSIGSAPVADLLFQVNTPLTIRIPLSGTNPAYAYSLTGNGHTISLQPAFDGKMLTFTHLFTAGQAGIYELKASANNMCGEDDATYQYIRVYNPDAGFITGGGTITSPIDARYEYMHVDGKANYGFVAKYKQGGEVGGHMLFNFKEGNMNFKSASLDKMQLIVAGKVASFKGKGTINGAGNYGFMLSAVDGLSNAEDKARMIIWVINADGSTGKVVYDNQAGAGEHIPASQLIEGGSIVIHTQEMATAVEEIAAQPEASALQVVAYPNPFQDKLTVDLSNLSAGDLTLTLADANGLVVYKKSFSASSLSSQVDIDLATARPGIYLLQTKQGKEITTTRVIKF